MEYIDFPKRLQTWLLVGLCALAAAPTSPLQAQWSGVVNAYQPVVTTDFCNNLAVVASASGFSTGDRVLLIQMQGATIDSSDTPGYGDIPSFGGSGQYELLTIANISANIVTFAEAMVNRYDGSSVQMIRVPSLPNASVDATVTGQPWDGSTGGVVALEVTGTLTLNADVDATGIGFRGGAASDNPACSGPIGYDGYRCTLADGCGGAKGEGIARISAEPLGRGRPANGGGGGNDQLTGGGGGSNFAIGGTGGSRLNTMAGDCPGDFPGQGGRTLPYSNAQNRAYMGGGAGAGDGANGTGTRGGNGGGIIIVVANEVVGNGFALRANGEKPPIVAGADGAGGGGGAGCILAQINTYTGPMNLIVRGGEGGDVDNGNDPNVCAGPGGGGSGGAVWLSTPVPAAVGLNFAGGIAGNTLNASAPMICGTNGAQPGATGDTLNGLNLVAPTTLWVEAELILPQDTFVCAQDSLLLGPLLANGTGTLSYLWSTGDTTAQIPIGAQPGPQPFTLTLLDERGCGVTESVTVTSGPAVGVEASPNGLIAAGQQVLLSATNDPLYSSYVWSPDSFLSTNTGVSVVASPPSSIEYCVEAADTLGCVTEACIDIQVDRFVAIPNAFTPNGDGLNDVFRLPLNLPCADIQRFQIFDRWGALLFEASDGLTGWDGTKAGKEVEIGSYIYVATGQCEDGRIRDYKGTVTVLR